MAADPTTRRPRSPVSERSPTQQPQQRPHAGGSPSVSELSSVVADGSGSIRSTAADTDDGGGHQQQLTSLEPASPSNNPEMSDVESLSDTSTVVDSLDDSDVESERSTSETYYDDLGGDVVLDTSDWEFVVPQHDITRTYASDTDDGGACPEFDRDSDSEDEGIPMTLPNPPSDISLEDDVDAVVLGDDDDVLVSQSSGIVDEFENTPRVSMDELKSRSYSSSSSDNSLDDDDVVKVSLSDGEEVLSEPEDEDTKREKMRIALLQSPKTVVDHGPSQTPRRGRVGLVGTGRHCSRREVLMERLRTVRTELQMVQVEAAAKSASAQLDAGEATRTEMSETKMKARKEIAALSTTLDFLAKMALQKAIELEAFQEARNGNGCAR